MIERAVAKDPDRRFPSAGGLIEAAREHEADAPAATRVLTDTPGRPTAVIGAERGARQRGSPGSASARRDWRSRSAVVLAVILAAFVAQKLFGGDDVTVSDPIEVGQGPLRVAVGERSVWVTSARDGTLSRIDAGVRPGRGRAAAPRARRRRRRGRRPFGLGLQPAHRRGAPRRRRRAATSSSGSPVGGRPGAIVFGGDRVWVADEGGLGVTAINAAGRQGLQAPDRPVHGAAAARGRRRRRLGEQLGERDRAPDRPRHRGRRPAGDRRPRPRRGHGRRRRRLGRQQPLGPRHPDRPGDQDPARRPDRGRRTAGRDRLRDRRRLGRQRHAKTRSAASTSRAARRSATRSGSASTPAPSRSVATAVWVADNGERRRHPHRALVESLGSIEVMARTSTSSASTRSARSRSTRSRRPTPGIPERRWRWPRSPTRSGSATSASTPPTRSGPNRDRFVLSAGHASMLLYSLLHLAGVRAVDPDYEVVGDPAVSLADIESFRQLDSRAPGHPEYRWTSGVETTTGPLGQGVATSVGMAIASKWQGARYGAELFDFDVYAIGGDGCLMEGVSGEAASLAGHLKLDNLCWIYDNNHITIDGKTELAYGDDVPLRFEGYGWNIVRVEDANDLGADLRRLRRVQGGGGAADADRRRQPHRLGLPAQGRHLRRPRRTARRGGGARDQARLRLARGRPVPRPRRGDGALRRGDRQARRRAQRRLGAEARRLRRRQRRARRRDRDRCRGASCRTAGTRRSRASTPTRRGSRPARPRTRSRTRSASACPGCWPAPPT